MGVWGTSLYAGDFAIDLRSTISALLRLPLDIDEIIAILCEHEAAAARDRDDEDHATFWLVLADQLAKRGIDSERARREALSIIDADDDLVALSRRGMNASDIARRRTMLQALRARIAAPPIASKPRTTLKAPQPLLMEVGDVLVYPTCGGRNINPYYASRTRNVVFDTGGRKPWRQDGWGAMVVIDRGRAFGFLSWYRAITLARAQSARPGLDALRGDVRWRLGAPGTCSASHFRKMELQRIGSVPIDEGKVRQAFPDLRPGVSAAVHDISIANSMKAVPLGESEGASHGINAAKQRVAAIDGLEQLLARSR